MYYDNKRVCNYFLVKTSFVSTFPDSLANCSTSTSVYCSSPWKILCDPGEILLKVPRNSSSSYACANDSPSSFGHRALKEQMVYRFILKAEMTCGTSNLSWL